MRNEYNSFLFLSKYVIIIMVNNMEEKNISLTIDNLLEKVSTIWRLL